MSGKSPGGMSASSSSSQAMMAANMQSQYQIFQRRRGNPLAAAGRAQTFVGGDEDFFSSPLTSKTARQYAPRVGTPGKSRPTGALTARPSYSGGLIPHKPTEEQPSYMQPLDRAGQLALWERVNQLHESEPYSQELRSSSMEIIKAWINDKLKQSDWASIIVYIKNIAEGSGKSKGRRNLALRHMGLNEVTLEKFGLPMPIIYRVYRALWVYSLGMHELMEEVAHNCNNSSQVMAAIWKSYAILFEAYNKSNYVMAIYQVEKESQKILKEMKELFVKETDNSHERAKKLRQAYHDLMGQLETAKKSNFTQMKTILKLEEKLKQAYEKVDQQLQEKEDMAEELAGINEITRAKDDCIEELKDANELLTQETKDQAIKIREQQSELNKLRYKLETNEEEFTQMRIKIEDFESTQTRLRQRLQDEIQEKDSANNRANVAERDLRALKHEKRNLTKRVSDLEVKEQRLDKLAEELTEENENLALMSKNSRAKVQELEGDLAKATKAPILLAKLEETHKQLKKERDELKGTVSSCEKKNEFVMTQLEKGKQEIKIHQKKCADLQKEKQQAETKLAESAAEIEKITIKVTAFEEKMETNDRELRIAKRQTKKFKEASENAKAQLKYDSDDESDDSPAQMAKRARVRRVVQNIKTDEWKTNTYTDEQWGELGTLAKAHHSAAKKKDKEAAFSITEATLKRLRPNDVLISKDKLKEMEKAIEQAETDAEKAVKAIVEAKEKEMAEELVAREKAAKKEAKKRKKAEEEEAAERRRADEERAAAAAASNQEKMKAQFKEREEELNERDKEITAQLKEMQQKALTLKEDIWKELRGGLDEEKQNLEQQYKDKFTALNQRRIKTNFVLSTRMAQLKEAKSQQAKLSDQVASLELFRRSVGLKLAVTSTQYAKTKKELEGVTSKNVALTKEGQRLQEELTKAQATLVEQTATNKGLVKGFMKDRELVTALRKDLSQARQQIHTQRDEICKLEEQIVEDNLIEGQLIEQFD